MAIARGKYAKAISDRSGMEFPYNEMVKEWNGMFVHKSEFEPKHPQIQPKPHGGDAQALKDARPDRTEKDVTQLLPHNPFTTYAASSSVINVHAPGHGLTNGTTYRFRGTPKLAGTYANPSSSLSYEANNLIAFLSFEYNQPSLTGLANFILSNSFSVAQPFVLWKQRGMDIYYFTFEFFQKILR